MAAVKVSYFAGKDLELIESLIYQPELKPLFEVIKGMLTWADEWPKELSPDGYEKLCDLWIARSYFHRGVPLPDRLHHAWSEAIAQRFQWPGFQRLALSAEDKAFYEEELASEEF